MHGIFSSTSSSVAMLGVLIATHVHLTVGGALSAVAHGLPVSEADLEGDVSLPTDRLFPFDSAEDDHVDQMLQMRSDLGDSEEQHQSLLGGTVSNVASNTHQSRSLPLLRLLLLTTQQRQPHRRTRAVSSTTGISLSRGYRLQPGLFGTAGRLKGIKPQHDVTGTGTLRYV